MGSDFSSFWQRWYVRARVHIQYANVIVHTYIFKERTKIFPGHKKGGNYTPGGNTPDAPRPPLSFGFFLQKTEVVLKTLNNWDYETLHTSTYLASSYTVSHNQDMHGAIAVVALPHSFSIEKIYMRTEVFGGGKCYDNRRMNSRSLYWRVEHMYVRVRTVQPTEPACSLVTYHMTSWDSSANCK